MFFSFESDDIDYNCAFLQMKYFCEKKKSRIRETWDRYRSLPLAGVYDKSERIRGFLILPPKVAAKLQLFCQFKDIAPVITTYVKWFNI